MLVALFFPFTGTFRRLELQRHWWHRLALVALVACVLTAFGVTLALTLGPDMRERAETIRLRQDLGDSEQQHQHGPWEQYAQITSLPPLPKGYSAVVMLSGNGEKIEFPADTTHGEMMKALCEHLKQGDPACWQVASEQPAKRQGQYSAADIDVPNAWRLAARDGAIALAVALAVDYLLQLAYRVGIFVIYGKPDAGTALRQP